MIEWIHQLADWTVGLANTPNGAWGLFWIALAESSFFPIPPDVLQIALSVIHPQKSFFYAGIALLGSLIGAAIGYAIGRFGGRPALNRLISEQKILLVEDYFNRYDVWAIGIAGFTPIPYKIFALSGGVFKINFWRFMWVSALSRGGRFFLVGSGLYFFGESIKDVLVHNINLFSVIFVGLLVGGFFVVGFLGKKRAKSKVA